MNDCYKDRIAALIDKFPLTIDKDVVVKGSPPTSANSEFLTNKEQGDCAERLVVQAINNAALEYVAIPYGRSDSIAAGDVGFANFYRAYQNELNEIGKKPDLLLFRTKDIPKTIEDLSNPECVSRAIAAIEVRSSSFLSEKYGDTMAKRLAAAESRCSELRKEIMCEPCGTLLRSKNPVLYDLLATIPAEAFKELTFRAYSWSSSKELQQLSSLLKELKSNITVLHKRDKLGITPKIEDIALVNRWISKFNVPHFYLQVFFDRAYVISFENILSLCCNPQNEGRDFSIGKDVKNQGKTTVKVNIDVGDPIIGRIDMPKHFSAMKELDRGRLLFYVKFDGGQGYLDVDMFKKVFAQ